MDVAIAFLVGIFIGSAAGIFTFALLAAAKMEAQDQHLLREVYINDSAVEVVASKMCLSKSYFYKLLHKALGSLLSIYNASCHEQTSIRARRLISEVIRYMPEGSLA